MEDAKKSSDWDLFQQHQKKNDRAVRLRSLKRYKALAVVAIGLGLGFVAYILLG